MSCEISIFSSRIGLLVAFACLLSFPIADASDTFTLIYAGEERGQLGLRGCGTAQVGGLSRRQTVINSLREKHPAPFNLHTGNILDPTDPNNELICQIALEALSAMIYDAVCLGPGDLCISIDSLSALYANHPDLPVVCTNLSVAAPNSLSIAPYIIQKVAGQTKVAVVGLISKVV